MATRLRRLKIERFRDLRPGTELFFNDGWNVLLGRNGSGKTTLLHLISMVLRDDFSEIQGEGFRLEYSLHVDDVGDFNISVHNKLVAQIRGNERVFAARTLVSGAEPLRPSWSRYEQNTEGHPQSSAEPVLTTDSIFHGRYWNLYGLLQRPEGGIWIDSPASMWLTSRSEQNCYRLDEGLASFDHITGTNLHRGPSLPHPSRTGFMPQDGGVIPVTQFGGFVPDSLWKIMASALSFSRPIIEFDLSGDVHLEHFVSLMGAQRVAVIAKSNDSSVREAGSSRSFGPFDFYAQPYPSRLIPHHHWSFGQQRLLTLFWYLACNPEVLVVDEPVNGLHWEWIEAFVDAIGDRQVFVTAQNPLLLEHVGFDSPEKVQRSFVLCRREQGADGEREMVWAQPTAEQAESFFRAWSTGVQPVHEVLKTEGLW